MKRKTLILSLAVLLLSAQFLLSQKGYYPDVKVDGYKDLKWGMSLRDVDALIRVNKESTDDKFDGVYIEGKRPDRYTQMNKYYDYELGIIVFLFFYLDKLYRIDVMNYAPPFQSPPQLFGVMRGQVDKMLVGMKKKYGEDPDIDNYVYVYNDNTHTETRYWWHINNGRVVLMTRRLPYNRRYYTFHVSFMNDKIILEKYRYNEGNTDIGPYLGIY